MPDFTGSSHPPHPISRRGTGRPDFDQKIRQLVAEWGCDHDCDLVEQIVANAFKMVRDGLTTADLKLYNRTLTELRYAARTFAPYADRRKISVFGSARTKPEAVEYQAAVEFGRKMREANFMVITGGGDGIMGAAQLGAGREASFGLNIRLPFEQSANDTIEGDPKLINFNYFFTRKLNFVKESHAIALFPGGFGTMDEGFEVMTLIQTGKTRIIPLVLVDPCGDYWSTWNDFVRMDLLDKGLISPDDFSLFKITTSVDEAVAEVLQFYRNFHSYRWVGKRMVIRLHRRLTDAAFTAFAQEFADVLDTCAFEQTTALPEESREPELAQLPRLVFCPKQKNFGRLRQLIDAINRAEMD